MTKSQVMANSVTSGEEHLGESLIDDRDLGAAQDVGACEFTTGEEGNAHVGKVTRTDGVAQNMLRSARFRGLAFDVDVGAPVAVIDQRFGYTAHRAHSGQGSYLLVDVSEDGSAA